VNLADIVAATSPVADAFEFLGVPYYIGGSVASSLHGVARATLDVDLVAMLHKLEWFRLGGEVSERQWGDVLGLLRVQAKTLNRAYLLHWAKEIVVEDLLLRA
jgi:hypothetical protein